MSEPRPMTAEEKRTMYIMKIEGFVWFGYTTKVEQGMTLYRNPTYNNAPDVVRAALQEKEPLYKHYPTPTLRRLADRTKRPNWAKGTVQHASE